MIELPGYVEFKNGVKSIKYFFKQKTIFIFFYAITLPRNFRFIDIHISPKILTSLDIPYDVKVCERKSYYLYLLIICKFP